MYVDSTRMALTQARSLTQSDTHPHVTFNFELDFSAISLMLPQAAAAAAALSVSANSQCFPSISITYHDHRTFVEIGCAMHTSVFRIMPFIFVPYQYC